MSEKLPQQPHNDEVDLVIVFKLIGNTFNKAFKATGNFFTSIFNLVIYSLKPFVDNFKLLTIILTASAILGYIAEKFKDPIYVSDMLVRPYYDSKYQLANNVNYFNALIVSSNYVELSNIFEIDSSTTAQQLIGFEIQIGPETQNDLIKEYDDYIKSLDSTLAVEVTYEDFIENRDILEGNIFSIKAKATNNDIFPSLEKGFIKTFKNEYSVKLKERTDSIRRVKKQTYLQELNRVESLQETYLEIKKNESSKGEVMYSSGTIPLVQEKTKTKEYELFQEERKIRKALREIEEELLNEKEYYDILSSFEEVGTPETSLYNKYSLIFPSIALIIIILVYSLFNIFKYVRDYE